MKQKSIAIVVIAYLEIIGGVVIILSQMYSAIIQDIIGELLSLRFLLSVIVFIGMILAGLSLLSREVKQYNRGLIWSLMISFLQLFYVKANGFMYTFTSGSVLMIGYDANEGVRLKSDMFSFSFNCLFWDTPNTQVFLNLIPLILMMFLYNKLRKLTF